MTELNGKAAEIMMNLILKDLGFNANCPVSREEVMKVIKSKDIKHFRSALYYIKKDYQGIEVGVDILVDRCLGIDGFLFDREDNLVSYDITVNPNVKNLNKKANVQHVTQSSRSLLDLNKHILIIIKTSVNYINMNEDQKWFILDSVLDAIDNNEKEVYIKL